MAAEVGVAGSDADVPCQHLEGGRLARSVLTQESKTLLLRYSHTHLVHRREVAVVLEQEI